MRFPRTMTALVACVVLCAPPAGAHNTSQGHSEFTVLGKNVDATIYLSAQDLHVLVGMDTNEDGLISDEEARNGENALGVFSGQTLRVLTVDSTGGEELCPSQFGGLDPAVARGIPRLYPFHIRFECPSAPETLKLRFGLFVGSAVRHVNVATVNLPMARVEQVLFSPDVKEVTLNAVPRSNWSVARDFFVLGVEHIVTGYDHLLFLLSLLLMALQFRNVVILVTSFTVAHSVTLCAAALHVASLGSNIVEPAIAASIVFVALEDLWLLRKHIQPRLPRAPLAFGFGLIHGFGFASALETAQLPQGALLLGLGTFNLGVEAGQLTFCALMFGVLVQLRKTRASHAIHLALSVIAALMGMFWFVNRVTG